MLLYFQPSEAGSGIVILLFLETLFKTFLILRFLYILCTYKVKVYVHQLRVLQVILNFDRPLSDKLPFTYYMYVDLAMCINVTLRLVVSQNLKTL